MSKYESKYNRSHSLVNRRLIGAVVTFILHSSLFTLHLLFTACSDYESFSSDPSFRLAFSTDTVAFDTLISTIPSSTKTLFVYNYNNDGMRINTIQLEGGTNSRFRVNVDG